MFRLGPIGRPFCFADNARAGKRRLPGGRTFNKARDCSIVGPFGASGEIEVVENVNKESSEEDRFSWMLTEARKLTALINLSENVLIDIYQSPSDWEFILKIDSLLEAAVRHVIKANLIGSKRMDQAKIGDFVSALPMQGRTSLLALLKATGCGTVELNLIESVRRVRNSFAHDIAQVGFSLIDVIKNMKDKSYLIKTLCYIENYDERTLIKNYEDDGRFFRFSILHGALIFLVLAYHGAIK
jgi:hypothetical protein